MVEDIKNADVTGLKNDLDQALSTLDLALLEAGRSVAVMRNSMAAVVEIAEHAREMEQAISRAREQLTVTFQQEQAAPPLRAVPTPEPARESIQELSIHAPEQEATQDELTPESEAPVQSGEETQVEEPADSPVEALSDASRCLRLAVTSKSGNLDLKEVDGSVNENPAVIDVALLDYDGRQATLKLWINETSDPNGVREALLSSLRNHLGEKDVELNIDFEQDSAA